MWSRMQPPLASISATASVLAVHRRRRNGYKQAVLTSYPCCQCAVLSPSLHREVFVTYNVLSNHLVHDGHRKRCPAADLESSVRLKRVQQKLSSAVARRAVIGLQEVSSDWAGEFHVFFARSGYQVVFAAYGEAFNGRMGVLLAYPSDRYVAETIRLHHVGDSLPETPSLALQTPPHLSPHGLLSAKGMAELLGLHSEALNLQYRYAPRGLTVEVLNPRQDREWGLATRRQNVAVLARLRPIHGGDSHSGFWVGVYHMPALFGSQEHRQTQNIHVLALRGALAGMAEAQNEPFVLIGDFNINPSGSAYNLFTGGGLGHEEAPNTPKYRRVYTHHPLTSAYLAFHGEEPGPRQLDYIWMSEGCRVLECPKLRHDTPIPSPDEPSDHLMVEAVVELPLGAAA